MQKCGVAISDWNQVCSKDKKQNEQTWRQRQALKKRKTLIEVKEIEETLIKN